MILKRKELLNEVNRMQRSLGRQEILHIPDYWQIFYELDDNNKVKGFAILYQYLRLPIENEYMTGRTAELTVFTFPEYRHIVLQPGEKNKGTAPRLYIIFC